MKPITLGWDKPAVAVSYYEVAWFFGSVQIGSLTTFDTEALIMAPDNGAWRFEVRAYSDSHTPSPPATLVWWVEEFDMLMPVIQSNGFVLRWPSIEGRVYEMDISYDGFTWTPVPGRYLGTGEIIEAGGDFGVPDSARYRVWSKPP